MMPKLGVNIDHVATLRQARRGTYPDPILAAKICEQAGAHGIVCHLREDRRHIQDDDVIKLRKAVKTQLNLELSLNPEIIKIAGRIQPDLATIVPERRQEITTEGGLDVVKSFKRVCDAVQFLKSKKIQVSLFIAPDIDQIDASVKSGAQIIEIHTGHYANAVGKSSMQKEFKKIKAMTKYARSRGLKVSAGHGLNYLNTLPIAHIEGMMELNIGHAIISESIYIGLDKAVKNMLELLV